MKKIFAWVMALTLLLCAACGRQPQQAETPETPEPPRQEQPQSPETPEVPQPPQVPETPATALEGPEECQILMAVKPEQTMFLRQRVAFLDGRTVAMVAPTDAGQQVQIVELVEGQVLSTFDLPGSYGETGRSVRLSAVTDKYHLSCHDGTDAWSILVDEDWQMEGWTVQPVEPELPTQWQMGSHIVTKNEEGSILVDGQVVLQGHRVVMEKAEPGGLWYGIKAVLDDHRLLFGCGGAYESEYMGIYDHETGETWTFGEKCCQIQQLDDHRWILYHNDHLRCYDLAFLDTDTETLTPLDTGFETIGTVADLMEMNVENTRLALADLEDGQAVIKLYDLTSGELLYHWNGPMSVQWLWAKPVGANKLVILTDQDGRTKSYQASEVPEAQAMIAPAGAVASVLLPSNVIPDLGRLEQWLVLEDNAVALLATREEQSRVLIFDLVEQAVLAECQVPCYQQSGSARQLSLGGNDPRTLLFYDGRDYWKLAADENGQLEAEEYDLLQQAAKMGEHTVEQKPEGIAVDGLVPAGLKTDNNRLCALTAILDDHRLLYQYTGYSVSSMMNRHVGVYDHSTGETRPLSTAGQQAWGVWGDTLLLARGGGPIYDMGWVDLADYTYTPLDIGHQTAADGVDVALCNADGTRLTVSWYDDSGSHTQVFDLKTGAELYRWSAPTTEWVFYPMDENGLVACQVGDGATRLWKVEY